MNPHLFVYGTLRSSAVGALGEAERRRLYGEARLLGEATLQGRLYDLGRYPGLTLSQDATELVHGEVVFLREPHASLPWLDAYEGITAQAPAIAEYVRIEVPVKLRSGQELLAWVYVYQGDCSQAARLADGRWYSLA